MATVDVMELHSAGETPRPRFDYRGRHRYVITLETSGDAAVFTTRERVLKVLNVLRDAAALHRFEVQAYCFLPSRVHLLVQGRDDTSYMKGFVSAFRSGAHAVMVEELGHTLWKKTFRERVLRKGESTPDIARDIWKTPVTEKLASTPGEYEFQGSFVQWLRPGPPPFTGRPEGNRPRPQGGPAGRPSGKPFRPRPQGEQGGSTGKPYTPRPQGGGYQGKSFRPRPQGEQGGSTGKPYTPRPQGGGYQGKSFRPRPQGEQGGSTGKPYTPRPQGGGYQGKSFRPRPQGEQGGSTGKPYTPRPQGGGPARKPFGSRPGGRPGGGSGRPFKPRPPGSGGGSTGRPFKPRSQGRPGKA